ncbi:MAG: formate dehydrogenase [Aquabacterium sp.]|nr:formate dehydrogenase [Aquabacterium sp.]
MRTIPQPSPPAATDTSPVSRRRLFAGAGTAGALAAAAAVLPLAPAPEPTAAAEPKPVPEAGGGYQLTAHVQHYYRTTKV